MKDVREIFTFFCEIAFDGIMIGWEIIFIKTRIGIKWIVGLLLVFMLIVTVIPVSVFVSEVLIEGLIDHIICYDARFYIGKAITQE